VIYVHKEYFESTKKLVETIDRIDTTDVTKATTLAKYLQWQAEQHGFYYKESLPIDIPQKVFKNKISPFEYNKHSGILSKYYYQSGDSYIKKNVPIDYNDAFSLLNNMILIAGSVVWVSFGFNIGCEFGGHHPAVIIKHLGKGLIVAPLSTGIKNPNNSRQIDVSKVYDFEERNRFTDVTRICPVSVYRVDLTSKIGNVHKTKLQEIKTALVDYLGK